MELDTRAAYKEMKFRWGHGYSPLPTRWMPSLAIGRIARRSRSMPRAPKSNAARGRSLTPTLSKYSSVCQITYGKTCGERSTTRSIDSLIRRRRSELLALSFSYSAKYPTKLICERRPTNEQQPSRRLAKKLKAFLGIHSASITHPTKGNLSRTA